MTAAPSYLTERVRAIAAWCQLSGWSAVTLTAEASALRCPRCEETLSAHFARSWQAMRSVHKHARQLVRLADDTPVTVHTGQSYWYVHFPPARTLVYAPCTGWRGLHWYDRSGDPIHLGVPALAPNLEDQP